MAQTQDVTTATHCPSCGCEWLPNTAHMLVNNERVLCMFPLKRKYDRRVKIVTTLAGQEVPTPHPLSFSYGTVID